MVTVTYDETLWKCLFYISEDSYTLIWSKKIKGHFFAEKPIISKSLILKIGVLGYLEAIFGGYSYSKSLLKSKNSSGKSPLSFGLSVF